MIFVQMKFNNDVNEEEIGQKNNFFFLAQVHWGIFVTRLFRRASLMLID